jgi:hypothetical protein
MFQPFQQWFVELFDILGNIAVIIALIIAFCGLSKWRKEVLGKKRLEISQKILSLSNKFRSQLHTFRESIAWYEGRLFQIEGKKVPHDEEKLIREQNQILQYMQNLFISIVEFDSLEWEAATVLQQEDISPIKNFGAVVKSLHQAVKQYYSQLIIQARESQVQIFDFFPKDKMEAWRQIIFGTEENDNGSILEEIDDSIQDIQYKLKKYLN